ncbi:MAG: T9SS type A sorting domain-containing protein [Bacteroidales bacterium]|nr:T9SS type A sorting domain-containing protein [Bacteroidales bacterium]
MKRITGLAIFMALAWSLTGQQVTGIMQQPDTADYPYWIGMMQDHDVNFFAVQKAFNAYWKDREITRGSGWKPFKRWEWWMESRVTPEGKRPSPDQTWNEYFRYLRSHPGARDSQGDWENLGPFHIPFGKGYKGLGRINAVAFHPTDPDVVFIGAPAGGLWRTNDGGSNWESFTDDLPTLGVSSIIVDYSNPDVIYMGTGDRDAGDASGLGVMKSTDGGVSWVPAGNGMGNVTVGKMIQHPSQSQRIYAATTGGIFLTTDGGQQWISKKPGGFKEIVFKPGQPSVIYAAAGANFFRSTDAGETWEQITSGLVSGSRGVIAVTPSAPEYVYFLITNNDSFKGLYRSTDGGSTFTERSTTPNIMSWGCEGGDGGQAWYDLDMAADPLNKEVIYAGGVNCFKSTDGGITWEISSHWWGDCGMPAVHADLHALEYNPADGRLYAANDGGIYWTDDGGSTWAEITDGLPISQVYRIGQCKIDKNKVINGYQDNGTSTYYGPDLWQFTYGGDGMECAFDHTDPAFSYATLYYGSIFRLYNNGNSYQIAGEGIHGITESGNWITPFCLHETDANTMFVGYKNLWRATGIKTNSFTWEQITTGGSSNIDVTEHSPADNDLFYYSWNNHLYRSNNVMETHPGWTDLSSFLPGSGDIRDIEAHPSDEDVVFMTQGSKVFRSADQGFTWTDITGSLPDIFMNTLAYYENSIEGLYVGSDAGVFYRDASMNDWVMFSNGLPVDASVNEVEVYHNPSDPSDDVVRAGTYGRGMWSSPVWHGIPEADFEADQTNIPVGCAISFRDLSLGVPESWQWTFQGATPSSSNEKNPSGILYLDEGTFDVTLTVTNTEGTDTKTIAGYITVNATTLPDVWFVADDSVTCAGKVVHFTDMSTNCPTLWTWSFNPPSVTFVNGTSQNSRHPDVVFNETASYTVTLMVGNNAGSNFLTREDYILVGGLSLPFSDDFESGDLSSKGWTIENPDYNITWDITTVGGTASGEKAAWMNFFDYVVPAGRRDRLISPVLSFKGSSGVYLSFEHAYAKRHVAATDSLIVYISDDCGDSWNRLFAGGEDGNGSFATHPLITTPFLPETPEDWCGLGFGPDCIVIDLNDWSGQDNIRIMFESYNHFSNNLYIDNVTVTTLTGIGWENESRHIHLFPNPTGGLLEALIPAGFGSGTIDLISSQGMLLFTGTWRANMKPALLEMDLSGRPGGIYFVRISGQGIHEVRKVILR